MKKLLNKRLADYTMKDGIAVTGLTILAMPVIWAGCMLPFWILGKISDFKEKRNEREPDENVSWFKENKEEP